MTLLRRLKLSILWAARRADLFSRMAATQWRRDRLLILCYHGVSLADEHEWSDVHISESRLRQRFELLRTAPCTVLPLDEALDRLAVGELPPCSVSVTFDEGLYDFHAKAYPLVQEFDLPTTLYVPTYYTAFRRPIFDLACSYLLWRGRGRQVRSPSLLPTSARVRIPESAEARSALHLGVRSHVNSTGYSAAEKDAMLADLADQVDVDWTMFVASRMLQLMSPQELASLDRRLVDVQLHTHRHRTPRSETLFIREIDDNIDALEVMGFPRGERRHFCYPSGDADPLFYSWLESRGIRSATTCNPRYATRSGHRLDLPRVIDTMAVTDVEFRAWTSGFAAFMPRRRFRPDKAERWDWDRPQEPARDREGEIKKAMPSRAGGLSDSAAPRRCVHPHVRPSPRDVSDSPVG